MEFGRAGPTAWAQMTGHVADPDRLQARFEAVADKVGPCVVSVEAVKTAVREGKSKTVEESGSGVLFRPESQRGAFVLTNNHVIAQADPKQITVSSADDRIFKPTQVWADAESDVAVLRLDGGEGLPAAALGDSDGVRVGQWVLAVGSPFGLNQTVTHGIISARERGQVSLGMTIRIKDFLQTDAAINPGSSGGPLRQPGRRGHRHQHRHRVAHRQQQRRRLQHPDQPGQAGGSATAGERRGDSAATSACRLALVVRGGGRCQAGAGPRPGAWVETVYPNTPAAAAGLRPNDVVLAGGRGGDPQREPAHQPDQRPGGGAAHPRCRSGADRKAVFLDAVVGDWRRARRGCARNP